MSSRRRTPRPSPASPPQSADTPHARTGAVYALGFLLLALATGWRVDSIAGRPVLNGGRIAAWGIGMASVIRLGMLAERSAAREEILYPVGELGVPPGIAILAAAHYASTRRPAGDLPGSGEEAQP